MTDTRVPVYEVSGESFETLQTRALLNASLDQLLAKSRTQRAAEARLQELRTDSAWVRRYFAGDKKAIAQYDHLMCVSLYGVDPDTAREQLARSEQTASEMRREAELKYDGPIPADVLAAIEEQSKKERTR